MVLTAAQKPSRARGAATKRGRRLGVLAAIAAALVAAGCTDRYAGDTRQEALDEATTALANQRADAEHLRLIGERRGQVLGREAWVFEYATPYGRICAYAWWDDFEDEDRSIVGDCR